MRREEREALREDRRRERDRERRLEERDRRGFKRSKLTRDKDRDVSEVVALGQARVGRANTGEAMYDQRLFNQDAGLASGLGADDAYNLYDKPLFADRSTAGIYRPTATNAGADVGAGEDEEGGEGDGGGRRERVFRPDVGFAGAEGAPGGGNHSHRAGGPVQFEQEADPFDLEGLIGDVKQGRGKGTRRPLDGVGRSGGMAARAGGADPPQAAPSGRSRLDFTRGTQ